MSLRRWSMRDFPMVLVSMRSFLRWRLMVPLCRFAALALDPWRNQLVELKSISPEMMEVLAAAVRARISIIVSGGTGAGKTTFLNILSQHIPKNERIVTIEDAAELQLALNNIVRCETRPPNIEGEGAVRQRQLLINSLRMRPDRIIIGEVRGEEAFDMLQAMNTGHEGSMTTIHANTPRDALTRLESMVAMSQFESAREDGAATDSLGDFYRCQVSRMSDGSRKVVNISEITGMEENVVSMQEIFSFQRKGVGPDGKVVGVFQPVKSDQSFSNGCEYQAFFFRLRYSNNPWKLAERSKRQTI